MLLKVDKNNWRKIEAKSATDENSTVQIFFNFDESPKARRENGSCRALMRIARSMANVNVQIRKFNNNININNKTAITVEAPVADKPVEVFYYSTVLKNAGVDLEKLKAAYEEGAPTADPDEERQRL